ncbi:MAG: alpha/beta hydrolase [Bifidobacteriaceae bacterium]|nr:alpha/beta hydrolase [Bifidobacteriaceae bacterium]
MTTSSSSQPTRQPWSFRKRLLASLPIFLILMGLLSSVSHITSLEWNNEPTDQSMATSTGSTAVSMKPTKTSVSCPSASSSARGLCAASAKRGTYKVAKKVVALTITRPSTGEKQVISVLIRYPKNYPGKAPGIVFMHGAGFGTAFDSFKDVATEMASAGFYSATLDKPTWSTNVLTRDYPASARAYDQVVNYLRKMPAVNSTAVGIYATSESVWISPYVVKEDPKVAFQILLSPMLFSPRMTLGFFVAQDFSIVGAHPGYQGIVRRIFSADMATVGLNNVDIDPISAQSLSIPTFMAYGSKDVMTSQVSGASKVMDLAHKAGNSEFVIRSYPLANHVLNIGDEHEGALADNYLNDIANWSSGIVKGYTQTTPKVGGSTIYQSIGLPYDIHASKSLTFYGFILHGLTLLAMLVVGIFSLVVLIMKLVARLRRKPNPAGIVKGFGQALGVISATTIASALLFIAGLGQIVMRVVNLVWGAAPEPAGMIYWSWYVVQFSTVFVVWAWSRIFAVVIEEGIQRGWFRWLRRVAREPEPKLDVEHGPIVAAHRLGLAYFICVTVAMLLLLLVFAYWGLFLY